VVLDISSGKVLNRVTQKILMNFPTLQGAMGLFYEI
jgi:hypothetical protein